MGSGRGRVLLRCRPQPWCPALDGRRRLLAGAGLLTLLMLADDLFQLHKPVVPDATGVPSAVVLGVYAAAFATWLWVNRAALVDTDLGVLFVALVFFALWITTKAAPGLPARISVSSGAKLCGIAGWTAYLTRTAWQTAGSASSPSRRGDPDRVDGLA